MIFYLWRPRPPRSTRTDPLLPYPPLFRSLRGAHRQSAGSVRRARGRCRRTGQGGDGVRDPAGEGVEVTRGVLAQRRAVLQPGIAGRGRRTVTEIGRAHV